MQAARQNKIAIETVALCKSFSGFKALEDVSIRINAGTFHALLGENGAGKSTLVKCLMGFYTATSGAILVNDQQQNIKDPRQAQSLGLGMVYQHFTLVQSLTGAENLVISKSGGSQIINWRDESSQLESFMQNMPFSIALDRPVAQLAAGEKQKLEILKQLYLGSRILILDEPTSVLTPDEANEVLSVVANLVADTGLTVLMITHKFREVTRYANEVTVLRQGTVSGTGATDSLSHDDMAAMMMNTTKTQPFKESEIPMRQAAHQPGVEQTPVLQMKNVSAPDRSGHRNIQIDHMHVSPGEVVGIAGISGNGQTELIELLCGQRRTKSGEVLVDGVPFIPSRTFTNSHHVRFLPEEPLLNACAQSMSVADNIALRRFDRHADGRFRFWLNRAAMTKESARLAVEFNIKGASLFAPISSLSGGNVQRSVLARELSGKVRLLIASNPCFGLDFAAVAEIRQRITTARDSGTAILLISEDLDEILELSDRILVISEGKINYQCDNHTGDTAAIGHYMAGHSVESPSVSTHASH